MPRKDYYSPEERQQYNADYYEANRAHLCQKKRDEYHSELCYHQAAARRRMKRYRKRQRNKRSEALREKKLLEKQHGEI